MAIANKIIPHYTFDDWVHWEGKWELIEGHPIAMSPTPVPAHQRAASEIRTELTLALRKSGCKTCRAYDPIDYKLTEDTILVPDVLIVCGTITKKYLDFPPALVVEILSPSTALKDRHTKYELYRQQKVKYYIIADPAKKTIEIFELKGRAYKPVSSATSFTFELGENCSIKPDLSNVFN